MRGILGLIACAIVLAGCRGKNKEEAAGDVARGPAATPALAVTEAAWTPEALDELVAPIALYPDQLVGQILAASVNAQEVLDAGNWLLQNENLTGAPLDTAAQKAGFGPAVHALVHFPTVVDMMCQEMDWTRQVGAAFTSDQKAVLDAVQRLRAQAADLGNLTSTPQQTVERKTEDGKEIVEVKPADPQVVYVPQYDPTIIYVTPPAPAPAAAPAAPVDDPNTVSKSSAIAGGLLAFGVGMMIGNAMDDDDYCYPHWGSGSVYYGGRPFYPPAYAYRPVYGPAFRPAVGYAPSAGYRNRYNSPTNVVINNNNYYNRFDNQQNLRVNNNSRGSGPASRQAGVGNRSANAGRSQDWKGQSSYAGSRGGASTRDAPTAKRGSSTPDRRPATSERKGAAQQPATGQRSTGRAQTQARPATQPNDRSGGGRDRGYGTSAPGGRDVAATTKQPAPNVSSREAPAKRDNALSGASREGTGSFDRAASARGHASAPASRERSKPAARRP